MEEAFDYDLLVVGSGPGGYVASIRAAQLGLKTAVIEKDKPGGVCLNIGCIPSKSLIHQAELFSSIPSLEGMGIKIDRESLDYKKIQQKSREAAHTLSKGVAYLLKKNNVDYIEQEAMITGSHEITLRSGKHVSSRFILIATGSRPKEIQGFPFDAEVVLSSTDLLMMKQLPQRILILGGGAIGVEFAYVMNAFGVQVTVVELMDRILPAEDEEMADLIHKSFVKSGIQLRTGTKAISMEKKDGHAEIVLETKDGSRDLLKVDKILVAVGRTPNSTEIGLENIDLETEKGFIPVGDYYQTKVSGIYAVGDVVNTPQLAHIASKEGEIAVEHMAGVAKHKRIDAMSIPGAVYCEPQIASFGYTEWRAKSEKVLYKTAVFPYRGIGKSVAIEKFEGLLKVLYHPDTKEILGGHCIGANATELIHEILLAKTAELLPEDIATMIHAHPTLSEGVMEVMRMAEGWAIHI